MERAVTLRDVAREAGVGVATVSRALNDDPRCAAATRQRVRKVADAMGYAPDPGVSALARRRLGKRVSYNLVWLREHRLGRLGSQDRDLYERTRELGARLGYHVGVESVESNGGPRGCARVLYQRGVRGIFLFSVHRPELIEEFDWSPFSVVAFDQENFRVPFDIVRPNHFRIFCDAFEKARAAGHTRVGVVLPSAVYARQNQLILGACGIHQNPPGEEVPPLILKPRNDGMEHYAAETVAWYERYRPTAVISKTEGALWPIRDAGYRCPEDFSFINTNLRQGTASTTGFDPELEVVARNLVAQMDSLVRHGARGRQSSPVTRMVEARWVSGATLLQR